MFGEDTAEKGLDALEAFIKECGLPTKLSELIKLLTNASDVSIELSDIECSCLSASYQTIKRVYLTVDEQVYSLEMCPAVMNFLEGFKISLNLVKI